MVGPLGESNHALIASNRHAKPGLDGNPLRSRLQAQPGAFGDVAERREGGDGDSACRHGVRFVVGCVEGVLLEMGGGWRLKFVVWKERFGFGQQLGFCLFKIRGGKAAFHWTLDLAHGALVKPDAFGTPFGIDYPD